MVRNDAPPGVRGGNGNRTAAPEEGLRNRRAAREHQILDVVAVEVRRADGVLTAFSGAGGSRAVERFHRLRIAREGAEVALHDLDRELRVPLAHDFFHVLDAGVDAGGIRLVLLELSIRTYAPLRRNRTEMVPPDQHVARAEAV